MLNFLKAMIFVAIQLLPMSKQWNCYGICDYHCGLKSIKLNSREVDQPYVFCGCYGPPSKFEQERRIEAILP